MRGAVILEGQSIEISGQKFIIKNFCIIPGEASIYVKLHPENKPQVTVNYSFEKLLPFLIEQIKL
jgi:hypothetical protein